MGEKIAGSLTYRSLLTLFFASVAIICLGGYRFYTVQRDAARLEVTRELELMADQKVGQIGAWHREHLSDAQVLVSDPTWLAPLQSIISGHASSRTRQNTLLRLMDFCRMHQYANAVLLDASGREVLHFGQVYGAAAHFEKIIAEFVTQKAPIFRDLHADGGGELHLGLNIPLRLPGDTKLLGMLSFAIAPERYLFPAPYTWPGRGTDGEVFLVRRNGEEALYLGKPDSLGQTSMRLRLPLSKLDAIAVRALNGGSGLIRGNDRHGRPVVAAIRAVPDSQWLVVAQLPLEAVDKPIRDRALPISLAVVSLTLAVGMIAVYLWRLQERRYDEAKRNAELETRALSAHYNYLSRSAHDAILLLDEEGRIVETNERAQAMYGFSREELLGMNAEALQAKESAPRLARYWVPTDQDSETLSEAVHERKDGSTFWVEIGASQIDVEGTPYHQAIIRDISQRKRARRQLENANRLYAVLSQCSQAILRAATEHELFRGVCEAAVQEGGFPLATVVQMETASQDVYPVATAGPARGYLTGIRLSARMDIFGQGVVGTSIRDGVTAVSDDVEHDSRMSGWRERAMQWNVRSLVCVPIRRGGRLEFAFALYSHEAAFFNTPEIHLVEEIAAKVSYALGRLDEESGRKAAEEALLQSEVRYRRLVESAPLGLYVHSSGLIKYMNPAGLRMLGATSMDALVGTAFLKFIHPDDHALVMDRVVKLQSGEPVPLTDERFVRMDGSIFHVEVSAVPIQFDGENSIFVFFIDATQRKMAEADRARMEEQLLQAQKMESIGRLAGGVAHDFNNNLTVINGYCDLLLSSLSAGDPIRAQISLIRKAGDQASKLTRQLLTFSRKQVFSPQRIDLNELVVEAKSLFIRLIGEQIQVLTRLAPALPGIFADPTQINQVLMNLAINARDAMPGGGELIIATDSVHLREEQAARVVGARPGRFVALTISDTGVGMDTETKRHIFEPFFTTKPRGSGTGLGLSTVYGIVQQSNGWVEVESAPGRGTTFRILLPAATGATTQDTEAAAKRVPGHETVLLVDDQDDVRSLTFTILESLGYSVLEAGSGLRALEVSARHEGEIDVLVTDIVMPGMNGRELAKRLRSQRPSIKVLLVSGYAELDGHEDNGMENGFDLLSKPFTPTALAAKVRELLRH